MDAILKNLHAESDFTLRIGNHEIAVAFESIDSEDGADVQGNFSLADQSIKIQRGMNSPLRLSTFFHELAHAWADIYGWKIKHRDMDLFGELMTALISQNQKTVTVNIDAPKDLFKPYEGSAND